MLFPLHAVISYHTMCANNRIHTNGSQMEKHYTNGSQMEKHYMHPARQSANQETWLAVLPTGTGRQAGRQVGRTVSIEHEWQCVIGEQGTCCFSRRDNHCLVQRCATISLTRAGMYESALLEQLHAIIPSDITKLLPVSLPQHKIPHAKHGHTITKVSLRLTLPDVRTSCHLA